MSNLSNLLEDALKNRLITSFDYNLFDRVTPIGKGGFGQVMRAYSKRLEKDVALKSLFSVNNKDFVKELQNFNSVNHHDNIIKFFGISKDTYYLVLQYAKDGDLRTFLRDNFKNLNWEDKINMAKDIARGLKCIHDANIVHRDLVRLSRLLDTNSNSFVGGMFAYSDPEYLRNPVVYKRSKASDIYSLGVLFWELSSGKPPSLEITKIVIHGKRETPINGTPEDYIKIYSSAWNDDPNERPTIENIRESLDNIQFENVFDENIQSIQSDQPEDNINDQPNTVNVKEEYKEEDFVSNANEFSDQTTYGLKYWERTVNQPRVSTDNNDLIEEQSNIPLSNDVNINDISEITEVGRSSPNSINNHVSIDQTLTDLSNWEITGIYNLNIHENNTSAS
ncbi:11596_t:CDS:2 [Diversispora eburnea]|uniref:11596_t:CDS:1 n=1 Tax=Diversispora eburnea TaxID=1213867 RepID=A0A9N9A5T9_9GLOM|nr:11596_t:CDS:2 [Diversispora eburnea]